MQARWQRLISEAKASALATTGPHGVNVVPVSVVEVVGDEVHLYDFFMQKSAENIVAEPAVALTCWGGFNGVQIKGRAVYETEGVVYEEAVVLMQERFPDRVLRAVIRIVPTAIHDVAPGSKGERVEG